MEVTKQLEEFLELEKKATPGEWYLTMGRPSILQCDINIHDEDSARTVQIASCRKSEVDNEQRITNAKLIRESKTLAPRMARALQAVYKHRYCDVATENLKKLQSKIQAIMEGRDQT